MTKAKKSSTKSKNPRKSNVKSKSYGDKTNILISATTLLFSGSCVVLIGNIQNNDNLKLLIIGFGSAMLVFGSVILGMAIVTNKR